MNWLTDFVNKVICGDCLEVMRDWPDGVVQTCITSPPYWGLRDYGVDGQLGLEPTPEEYVAKMVGVFREVRRVLRDDGTLWLNLGDSYVGGGRGAYCDDGSKQEDSPAAGMPAGDICLTQEGTKGMDAHIKFEVPGEPVAKGRPKFARAGKFTRTYTPAKTVNYETRIQEVFASRFPQFTPLTGPVKMVIKAWMTIPRSASKKKQLDMIAGQIWPTKKPDLDNIVKIVGDALNGLAFVDDKQVDMEFGAKHYSDRPRLEIEISEIGGPE